MSDPIRDPLLILRREADLVYVLLGSGSDWLCLFMNLYAKSDVPNRYRLARVYPAEAAAFHAWADGDLIERALASGMAEHRSQLIAIPHVHAVAGPRRFVIYRRSPPPEYREGGHANAPDEAQLEGVVWSDGTVAVRWLTQYRSTSLWPDLASFEAVHGHPEYESELRWLDP